MPQSKYEAFQLESGYEGLTRFIHNQNKKAVVAGADGHIYDVDQCQNSRRFRVPRQDNLLVSDNQTRAYEEAGPAMRRILELTAWGEFITQYED